MNLYERYDLRYPVSPLSRRQRHFEMVTNTWLVGCGVMLPRKNVSVSAAPFIRTPLNTFDKQLPEPDQRYEDTLRPFQGEPPCSLVVSVKMTPFSDPEPLLALCSRFSGPQREAFVGVLEHLPCTIGVGTLIRWDLSGISELSAVDVTF